MTVDYLALCFGLKPLYFMTRKVISERKNYTSNKTYRKYKISLHARNFRNMPTNQYQRLSLGICQNYLSLWRFWDWFRALHSPFLDNSKSRSSVLFRVFCFCLAFKFNCFSLPSCDFKVSKVFIVSLICCRHNVFYLGQWQKSIWNM